MRTDPSRRHWHELTREQQADTIRHMRAQGMSEDCIAMATELSTEFVKAVLGERARA